MVVVMSNVLSGLSAWLVQRLSAIYLLLYTLLALVWLVNTPTITFPLWYGLFAQPLVAIATAMFMLALLMHIWVGVRDVILDYAGHFAGLRLTLLALLGAWLIVLGIWSATILLKGVLS
jgi:succinate dehydrogenase / fumarate reductase, membrane anchor subunit